jgi:hypothetical protein
LGKSLYAPPYFSQHAATSQETSPSGTSMVAYETVPKKSGSNGLDRQEDIPSTIGMVDIEFLSTSHGLFQATEGKFSG